MSDGQGWDVDGLTVALAEAEAVIEGLTYENERLRAAVQAVRTRMDSLEADGDYNPYAELRSTIDAALGGERDE